uniref:Sodium/potassium-transporting ATPase subunit beta n=2 Tax=Poecilia formosa TaxID=48698 RepID=A0A087XJD8_POEFO
KMAKDGEKSEWKEFLWNPRTREFLGRTASSWGLIILFYIVFYLCLGGLFALTMYIMLQTLDDHKPTWQDRLSTPGLVIRPRQDETFEIVYTIQNTESWDMYAQALDRFLSPYNDSIQAQKNHECTPEQYFLQEDSGDVKNNPKRSCQFNRTILEACSGLHDRYYGYQEGKPCIIIKLNRVIGLMPGKDGQAPSVTCGAKDVTVTCRLASTDIKLIARDDSDKIGEMIYFPSNGTFDLMYYPYYGKKAQVNYSQPLVAVKFLNITVNQDVNIECKIHANNIPTGNERDKFAGRVSFKLRINSQN